MASTKSTLSLILILALITTITATSKEIKETSMTVYFQDQFGGQNVTTMQILPENSDGHLDFKKFGAIFCTDDPITEEFAVSSVQVARGQGIHITSALDGSNTHVLISIVFENGTYKGSTLEVQGSSAQFERVSELAVVGGTGKFRFARGYITLETIHLNVTANHAIIQGNLTVQHY